MGLYRQQSRRTKETWPIATAERLDEHAHASAVSLLFAPGLRPRAAEVHALADAHGAFSISLDTSVDGGQEEGWLELVANGMSFDLVGLAPQPAIEIPATVHSFGLAQPLDAAAHRPLMLTPGPHVAAGGAMVPVVRTLAGIAAHLVRLEGATAVAWHPARSVSDAAHFRAGVMRWLGGGAFPGLGLTALVPTAEGGLMTEGLSLFTGQELRLAPEIVDDRAQGATIALRLLNWLVEHGPIAESYGFSGPSGETLHLEPLASSRTIEVRRGPR